MIELLHRHDDRLIASWRGQPLFEYVYVSRDMPFEGRRPFFHPVYSLAGDCTTQYRPDDHPWHKGISMTFSVINDQNFWGGPTYDRGRYQPLDNVGQTLHQAWDEIAHDDNTIQLHQRLAWITAAGETWLQEHRSIHFQVFNDSWEMDWQMKFDNVSGQRLHFGSPMTQGRPHAGYTGLFWRGTDTFRGGRVLLSDGRRGAADAFNSARTLWLAYTDTASRCTLLFENRSDDTLLTDKWFVRGDEYAGTAFSFAYDQVFTVEPKASFRLRHRIAIINGQLPNLPTPR